MNFDFLLTVAVAQKLILQNPVNAFILRIDILRAVFAGFQKHGDIRHQSGVRRHYNQQLSFPPGGGMKVFTGTALIPWRNHMDAQFVLPADIASV